MHHKPPRGPLPVWLLAALAISLIGAGCSSKVRAEEGGSRAYASDDEDEADADTGSAFASDEDDAPPPKHRKPLRLPTGELNDGPLRIRVGKEEPLDPGLLARPLRSRSSSLAEPEEIAPEEQPLPIQQLDDQPAPSQRDHEVEPLVLKGIQPGISTAEELQAAWGQPKSTTSRDGVTQHVYDMEPFEQVTAVLNGGRVASIVVDLHEPLPAEGVAAEMGLSDFEPAQVANQEGQVLGWAFPERGVLFRFVDGHPGNVVKLILEPITPEPFTLRAELRLESRLEDGLQDLSQALKIDPHHARAHWLQARCLSSLGRLTEALDAAQLAVKSESDNQEYRLTLARLLDQGAETAAAIETVEQILAQAVDDPLIRAQAQHLLGVFLAGQPRDYRRAAERQMAAIKTAQPLLGDPSIVVRNAARETLISANLAMAYNVAWGSWKDKDQVVEKWLNKAAALAVVRDPQTPAAVQFHIASQALAALVGLQGAGDAGDWCDMALASGRELVAAAPDARRRQQLEWELGTALYDALQVYHLSGEYGPALKYGRLAIQHLESAARGRQLNANQTYLLGRVYFRIGLIQALHNKNHQQALAWFNHAQPLLEQVGAERDGEHGRVGESLISIAVSHWEEGQREEALQLTSRGVALIEEAVQEGQMTDQALTVPYSNLAFMQRSLGNKREATRLEAMAAERQGSLRR